MREIGKYLVLVLVLAAVLNLPLVSSWRNERELDENGVDVTAMVVEGQVVGRESDPRYVVEFAYADDVQGGSGEYAAFVDEATYTQAMTTKQLEVRVLPDDPDSFRADGQQEGNLLVVLTLTADVVLLLVGALMFWRLRNPPDDDERLTDGA